MLYTKEPDIENIGLNLRALQLATKDQNSLGLFDNNRAAQEFFAKFFNILVEYNLVDIDKLSSNFTTPAIDLGDDKKRICVQVTIESNADKITSTLNMFVKLGLYDQYDRLIFFILGTKELYPRAKFDTQGLFTFNKNEDIWDIQYILDELNKESDLSKIAALKTHIETYTGNFLNPDRLYEEDIKKCIKLLKKNIDSILKPSNIDFENVLKTSTLRSKDYLEETKNPANNISKEFYKNSIKPDWKHNGMIFNFLNNSINRECLDDYAYIISAIREFYDANADTITTEKLFGIIFHCCLSYESDIDFRKLKIFIHNMYINCDIGKDK